MRTAWLVAVCPMLASGCSYTPPPVHVSGPASQVEMLAGQWDGSYESRETGRYGSITFELAAGSDTAYGDILMIPRAPTWVDPEQHDVGPAGEVLSITFVAIEGGLLRGTLEPYRDPQCGCVLDTAFEGALRDNAIQGTFVTRHLETGEINHGTWRAVRRQKG